MSQIGKISKIGIAKILTWAEQGKKTGAFVFTLAEDKKYLYFKSGEIVSASSNSPKERLGQIMLRMGIINAEQIEKIQDVQRKEKSKFGKTVLQLKFATQKDLLNALNRQTEEIIINLFDWTDGEFLFYLNKLPPIDISNVNHPLDEYIAKGKQRQATWQKLWEQISSFDTILEISFDVPAPQPDKELNPDEFKIMTLVDGFSSVREICNNAHLTDFETVQTLGKLLQQGYIKQQGEEEWDNAISSLTSELSEPEADDDALLSAEDMQRFKSFLSMGEYEDARNLIDEILQQNAPPPEAVPIINQFKEEISSLANIPRIISMDGHTDFSQLSLDPKAGFIMSRIDGKLNIKLLSNISGFPKDDVQEIVITLFLKNIIAIQKVIDSAVQKATASSKALVDDKAGDQIDSQTEDLDKRILEKYQKIASEDYYQIIGVEKSAEAGDIKKAYHEIVKKFHPDMLRNNADPNLENAINIVFDKIQLAYDTLSDEGKRTDYDRAKGFNLTEEEQKKIARLKAKAGLQYQIGIKAYKARNYKKAIEFIKSAIDINPNESVYYSILAEIQSKNPKWINLAEENAQKAIELDPHNPLFYNTLGAIYKELGRVDQAVSTYRKTLEVDPGNEDATNALEKMGKDVTRPQTGKYDKIITKDIALR